MAEKKRTEGFSGRLRERLETGPRAMTVREFARALQRRDPDNRVRGKSASGVRHYVDGEVLNPRLSLLQLMAAELDVRWEKLAYGEGEWTEAEEETRIKEESYSSSAIDPDWTDDLTRVLEVEMGGAIPPVALAVVAHQWRKLERACSGLPGMTGMGHSGADLVAKFARALVNPLREFDVEGAWTPSTLGALDEEQRAEYLIGVTPVIGRAIENRVQAEFTEGFRQLARVQPIHGAYQPEPYVENEDDMEKQRRKMKRTDSGEEDTNG